MSRDEEYEQKRSAIRRYYAEEIEAHESAGCDGDADNARKWLRAELGALRRQFESGEEMRGAGMALRG